MHSLRSCLAPRIAVAAVVLAACFNAAGAAENVAVDFRLVQWRSAHVPNANEAAMFEQTLRRLGCEAASEQHGDHIDVAYRCPQWRRLMAKSHDDAHRWIDWLEAKGFETCHQH
jgi:hypothetical protein